MKEETFESLISWCRDLLVRCSESENTLRERIGVAATMGLHDPDAPAAMSVDEVLRSIEAWAVGNIAARGHALRADDEKQATLEALLEARTDRKRDAAALRALADRVQHLETVIHDDRKVMARVRDDLHTHMEKSIRLEPGEEVETFFQEPEWIYVEEAYRDLRDQLQTTVPSPLPDDGDSDIPAELPEGFKMETQHERTYWWRQASWRYHPAEVLENAWRLVRRHRNAGRAEYFPLVDRQVRQLAKWNALKDGLQLTCDEITEAVGKIRAAAEDQAKTISHAPAMKDPLLREAQGRAIDAMLMVNSTMVRVLDTIVEKINEVLLGAAQIQQESP